MFTGCISLFYYLFYTPEDGMLNPSGDVYLFSLPFCVYPLYKPSTLHSSCHIVTIAVWKETNIFFQEGCFRRCNCKKKKF